MAATLECPECGRRLAAPTGTDAVICDGCEFMFDPASLRRRPAPLWKRALGGVLIVLGVLSLVATLSASLPKFNGRDTDSVFRLGGSLLFIGLLIAWGRSLTEGKLVVGSDQPDAPLDPEEIAGRPRGSSGPPATDALSRPPAGIRERGRADLR